MTVTVLFSSVPGQTPFGLYTNLWPTRMCRVDRATVGAWYVSLHIGRYRCQALGMIGPISRD